MIRVSKILLRLDQQIQWKNVVVCCLPAQNSINVQGARTAVEKNGTNTNEMENSEAIERRTT